MKNEFVLANAFKTPVLFLVFNRPDTTKIVFDSIRKIKPPKLYVAADGARLDKHGEDRRVENVRNIILSNIDWECEVRTLFRNKNLGCKHAVSNAISWFFENEEKGIILEDDCLPNQSFFSFCEELLEKYKNDYRVWHITGNNFGFTAKNNINADYLFARYAQVWGWATWRDRWINYDKDLENFKMSFDSTSDLCATLHLNPKQVEAMKKRFYLSSTGQINTWDYQWHATVIANGGRAIFPIKNLISNIGDGADATHTPNDKERTHLETFDYSYPLRHPADMIISSELEEHLKRKMGINVKIKVSFKKGIIKLKHKIEKIVLT